MTRIKRSKKLIATFTDDYADGWFFKVHKSFKDQLDIKLTDRVVKGEKIKIETQGTEYSFYEGSTFSNKLMNYKSKKEFFDILKQEVVVIQIQQKLLPL